MLTLHLSDKEVTDIMEGLSAMPLHKAFDTFISVRNQVMAARTPQAQQGPQAVPPAAPEVPPNGRDVPQ